MANLPESNTWESVRQWEVTDPAMGGTNGVMNTPLKSLVNRTAWLKNLIEEIIAGTTGLVGKLMNGSTVANSYTAQQNNTAVASTAFVQSSVSKVAGRRNVILNGDMRISQRDTDWELSSDGKHFTIDRWIIELTGRDTDVGQEPDQHRGYVPMASHSMRNKLKAGTGTLAIRQRIENVWTLAGGKAVLQFCAGVPFEFDTVIKLKQYLSSAQMTANNPYYETSQTVRLLDIYDRYTVIFDVPELDDVVQADVDNGNCLEISIETTDTRAIDFWITNVQLEAGVIPTDFEIRNDWNECLRYFEKGTYHERYDDAQNIPDGNGRYSVFRRQYYHKKRIVPTITKENITYTALDSISNISNIQTQACTLEIKPTSLNGGVVTQREIQLDLLIDAEIV